jgi:UDP-N-acetylmuramate: L-alanyl-gamma-D-glutamyl-meso-diaminopimelate ligase
MALNARDNIKKIPYKIHGYFQNKTGFYGATHNRVVPLKIFGEHNMQNLSAAKETCLAAGVTEDNFYSAIESFEGISKRLQKLIENEKGVVYFDFAHSPAMVKAAVEAIVARYPGRAIIACLELHAYSSLSIDFLPLYEGTMESATAAFIYFNPHTIGLKKLEPISKESVKKVFGGNNVWIYNNSCELFSEIKDRDYFNPVYLFMSSGDFEGFSLKKLIE